MKCRSCAGAAEPVLSLGEQVPANRFLAEADLSLPQPKYDLTVCLCEDCGLAQLRTLVPPEDLFLRYPYRTGSAAPLRRHLRDLAKRFGGPGKKVVEVGSNDGALLREFQERGSSVVGFEPAENLAALANAEGLSTRCEFFGEGVADLDGTADVVVARNVFAHCPDSHGFLEAVKRAMKPDGAFLLESPWVASMFVKADIGQVYHEHSCYLGVGSLKPMLEPHGLFLEGAEFVNLHGGSVLYRVGRGLRSRQKVSDRKQIAVAEYTEWAHGCYEPIGWETFEEKAKASASRFVETLKARRGKVAGYCAAAKGMVWLQWCGVGPDLLPVIYDETPEKQGVWTPGSRIPVLHPEGLERSDAKWLAVLAWNWLHEVRENPSLRRFLMFSTDGRMG